MVSRRALGASPWVAQLCGFNAEREKEARDEDAIEAEVQGRLNDLLKVQKQARDIELAKQSGKEGKPMLPRFFTPKEKTDSSSVEVATEARLRFLHLRHEMLLDNAELENLWFVLQQFAASEQDQGGAAPEAAEHVDYDRYCQISVRCADVFGEKSLPFFTPSTFLRFKRDARGRIGILPLFHYIMRKVSMQQTRIYLSYHDGEGDGYLTEVELQAYVEKMIPSLPPLADLEPSFQAQYVRIAVRKLLFFNDPHRLGKVKIGDLLVSAQLAEFLELRQELNADSPKNLAGSWFSLDSAKRVYSTFLELDEDMDGLLSPQELGKFGGGGLTSYFVDALFQEHVATWHARRGRPPSGHRKPRPTRMDFPCFLEFLLAWEDKKHPVSVAYFFRVLDRDKKHHLTSRDLHLFFRDVHQKWVEGGHYDLAMEDVKDEMYDMVSPKDKYRMTLQDILDSKQGDTIVNILSDITGFWRYDSREMLMQQEEQEEEL